MNMEMKVRVGDLQRKMQLKGKGHTDHEVQIDYIPPYGEDNGFTPLELLMISLASCSGHTIQLLLQKMGKTIEQLEVLANGTRRMDGHPTIITDIDLQFNLKGDKLDAPSVENAIKMSEKEFSPVWAMLKSNVAITWNYSIS
jgi:putative redox protein